MMGRYRECKLYYYLEDDSIAVVEQKQANSGLIQVAKLLVTTGLIQVSCWPYLAIYRQTSCLVTTGLIQVATLLAISSLI
jgi:hypothetical protein